MASEKKMTQEARASFDGKENTHKRGSSLWYAAEIGAYFQRTGRTYPFNVRKGRGYSIHINDMLFKLDDAHEDVSFIRIH